MVSARPQSLHHRLRRLKAALLAVSFTLAGILLMMLNAWLTPLQLGSWQWLHALPLGELGGTLFGAGLLSTFFEYTLPAGSGGAHAGPLPPDHPRRGSSDA